MPEEKLDVDTAVQEASVSMAEIARSRPMFQRPTPLDYRERARAADSMREREYRRDVFEYERVRRGEYWNNQAYGRGMRLGGYDPDRSYMESGNYSDRATEQVSNFMDRALRGIHLTGLQARHLHAMIERATDPYEMIEYNPKPIRVPMKVEAKIQVSWKTSKTGRKFRSA